MKLHSWAIRRPTNPLPKSFVPQGGVPYRVVNGDSWVKIAGQHNMNPWALIRFNYPNLPVDEEAASREVNWYLQEYVGCLDVTPDRKNYVFSLSATPGIIYVPSPQKTPQSVQPNYVYSLLIIPFMYSEMIKNAKSQQVAEIDYMLSGKRALEANPLTGEPGERAARAGMMVSDIRLAAEKWRDLVRSNRPWDHKPKLRQILRCQVSLQPPSIYNRASSSDLYFPIQGNPHHKYYYDIWSNIHYGYVGSAAGFPGNILQWGAARGGAAGRNDPIDIETVQIGIDLWDRYGVKLTQQQLHQEILRRTTRLLEIQQTSAYQNVQRAGFRHVLPL